MTGRVGRPARIIGRVARGAAAGLAATVPMTATMIAFDRVGLLPNQPPRAMVDRFLPRLDDATADRIGLLAHLAYGAAAGAVLHVALPSGVGRPVGIGYGLLLWAAGYEGWVPAVGVLPPAHRDARRRVAGMVLAHVVFGAALSRALRAA